MSDLDSFLVAVTDVCRRYGYAIDMGDGEFRVYPLDQPGDGAVAAIRWDHPTSRLVIDGSDGS